MRNIVLATAFMFAAYAAAADELDDAHFACGQHTGTLAMKRALLAPPPDTPKWESGWEHCDNIEAAFLARQTEFLRDKAKADLEKTKALSGQIGKK